MSWFNKISVILVLVQLDQCLSWDTPRFANMGEFPFQVSLEWHNMPVTPARHLCGGAILSELWVISSGYCLSRVQVGVLYVKVGRHDIAADNPNVREHAIEKKFVHPRYPGANAFISFAAHDLSLIKVSPAIVFNNFVKPLKLPKKKGLFKGQKLNYNMVASGWGSPTHLVIENHPTTMMTVQLPIIENKICADSINTHLHNFRLHDSQMCTRPLNGRISGCIGDYGGPLIQYNKNNEAVLVAIQSWSTVNCNTVNVPPVYARVLPDLKWIKSTMRENEGETSEDSSRHNE